MFPKPKLVHSSSPSEDGRSVRHVTTLKATAFGTTGNTTITGPGMGRMNSADWVQNPSYFWRNRFQSVAVCEPEHDEAFVEESGIKVVESSHDEAEEDDEDNIASEDDGDDDEEVDPLYALDVLDDTIVEDDEDEEEEEDEEKVTKVYEKKLDEYEIEEVENKGTVVKRTNNEIPCDELKKLNYFSTDSDDTLLIMNPTSSNAPPASALPPPQQEWSYTKIDSSSNSSSIGSSSVMSLKESSTSKSVSTISTNSSSDCIENSETGPGSLPMHASRSTALCIIPQQPTSASKILPATSIIPNDMSTTCSSQNTTSAPNSRSSSRSSSPLAIGLTGNMWAGMQPTETIQTISVKQAQSVFSQCYPLSGGKGRGGRLILPLARTNAPRHKFTIRKVIEQEATKKNSSYIDSRHGELRNPEVSATRHAKTNAISPVWVRRQVVPATESINNGAKGTLETKAIDGYNKSDSHKSDGEKAKENSATSDGGGFRPRAGTWSVANARRHKIKQDKEEEASKQRQRRKSGDDIQVPSSITSASQSATIGRKDIGFFDSFRHRSKTTDAKIILQPRVRRKSGDDLLNAREKKKDTSPGFLDSFRPRSKSDASKGKKPNLMTTVKNAVQHSLVTPGAAPRSGRRSGDATPEHPPQGTHNVYHTWHGHAGSSGTKSTIGRVMDLFRRSTDSSEERLRKKSGGKHEKGQLNRRHSMDPDQDRRRHGSGSTYVRGEDPDQAALLFRESRRLPAAAVFLENFKRSELEEDESQILVKFFKYHHTYDLIPTSAKLVIFDTRLQVKKAFYALVYNGVRAAPLWDAQRQEFVGMLTITDFIRILQSFYSSPNRKMEELEDHRLEKWRTLLHDDVRKLISISPNECLYEAIRSLIHHKIHRLPVIESSTGNVLYIITHKRILKFLFLYITELPKPSILLKTLRELNIGTYENIETALESTLLIEALNKFVKRRISALPIVDSEGKLIDIYAKFDVINLAAEGTYHNLDITLQQANEYRNEWFEGVRHCNLDETMGVIMERIVRAEVHRLVVVDKSNKVIGVISLSDILNELVLKPCHDDPHSLKNKTVADMEAALDGGGLPPQTHSENISDSVESKEFADTPDPTNSKDIPDQIESENIPDRIESENIPDQIESENIPDQIESEKTADRNETEASIS